MDSYTIEQYADILAAMGTEARLRIIRLLLKAHPKGLIVGDIQKELNIANSTLSHHLEKLKNEKLVNVQRESQFLWYSINVETLQALAAFLLQECCIGNVSEHLESKKPTNINAKKKGIFSCCKPK